MSDNDYFWMVEGEILTLSASQVEDWKAGKCIRVYGKENWYWIVGQEVNVFEPLKPEGKVS